MRFTASSIVIILALLYIIGCNADSTGIDAAPRTPLVIVVGDDTASAVMDQLAKHGIRTSPALDHQSDSSVIVIALDSTVGPLPIHLEIARTLQKRPAEEYVWVFTNTSMVDDQELLELEELECREILNDQGLPGDYIMFGFDSPTALVRPDYQCPKGWEAIARHIRRVSG